MTERVRKPDYFRDARRTFGLVVIILYFLFFLLPLLFGLVQLITGHSGEVAIDWDPLPWGLYALAYVSTTASVVAAAKIFRTKDRRRSWRLTGWMMLLFVGGVAVMIAFAIVIDSRNI